MIDTKPGRMAGLALVLATVVGIGACGKKPAPIARPTPPPPGPTVPAPSQPPAPPERVVEAPIVPPDPGLSESGLNSRTLDELNRDSPLQAAFFELDSAELSQAAQTALTANADVLKKYATWIVTVEGHCDERGTAQYNLALGERRAAAAKSYLQSLGVAGDRMRIVSYGKEFPFDPGHSEGAWAKNRRAHFVITAK